MQISLNLNLIINEVSDSQIASPHQKLADTSVRRARLASAGPHAKPLLPGRGRCSGKRGRGGVGVPTAGAQTSADFYNSQMSLSQGTQRGFGHLPKAPRQGWSLVT